jgi:hypothetical protein
MIGDFMRLSNCNAHQVLTACFSRFTAYRGATQTYGNVRVTGSVDARLERLCDDKIASAVIGYVDRMDKISNAYCYFCFSDDANWDHFCLLVNTVINRFFEKNPDLRKERLVHAAKLCGLVPYEYRYRLANPTKTLHSWDHLAKLLDMRKEHFRGAGREVWSGLLDELADLAMSADNEIVVFVRKLNHLDEKPSKIK